MKTPRHLFAALGLALAAVSTALAAPAAGKKALLVLQAKAPADSAASDAAAKSHLESLGFAVTTIDQAEPAPAGGQHDLVVISSTVSAYVLAGKYRHVTQPVVLWESNVLDDLGMSGKKLDRDFGEVEKERHLWLVNAPHPLSAGLPAGTVNVYKKGMGMNWGKPGLGATIIATLPGDPEKAAIFAYEKGATMDYESLAPARRVMLFLNNDTFPNLNAEGLKLFDAAILWAIARPGS